MVVRKSATWPGLVVLASALVVYLATLAPGLVRGDGGELQFILATLGVAHPTGYPLYSLLGWLWAKVLPVGAVAWRLNALSAVCGAGTVALVYGIGYRLTRRLLPALAGALFLAFSPAFWTLSSVTEVYALHALFVALLLMLLLLWRDAGPGRRRLLLLIALVYGLSLSHHRMMLLLAPAVGLFLLLEADIRSTLRHVDGRSMRYGLLLVAAFVAGLLPYAHVFIQQLRRGRTVQHVVFNVILGGDFSGFLGLRSDPVRVLWELPRQELGVLGLVLAVAGLAWLAWRQRSAAWLLGGAWLANVVFCLFYRVPDIEDFTLPATLVLAILAGASGGWLSELGASRARKVILLAEIALFAAALFSVRHLPQAQAGVARRDDGIEAQARALLAYPFESGAVVATDWDLSMAVRFLRTVEDAPDGVQVNPVRPGQDRACTWLRRSLDGGGPLYVASPVQLSRLPDGYTFSETPPYLKIAAEAPDYVRLDRQLHAQLTLEGVQHQGRLLVLRWLVVGTPLTTDYSTYAHFFDAAGQPLGQQDKGTGAELSCWYPLTTWPPGQVIQDLFLLPSDTASVRVGVYAVRDGQVDMLGTDTLFAVP